jgi:hypothetical protein
MENPSINGGLNGGLMGQVFFSIAMLDKEAEGPSINVITACFGSVSGTLNYQ